MMINRCVCLCWKSLSTEINILCVQKSLEKHHPWSWVTEHIIFPAFRAELIPPRQMAEDGSVLQIADLHELYKVFERC